MTRFGMSPAARKALPAIFRWKRLAAWLLIAIFPLPANGQEQVKPETLQALGWRGSGAQNRGGLELELYRSKLDITSSGPEAGWLLIRPTVPLRQPLTVSLEITVRLDRTRTNVRLAPQKITLPKGYGGTLAKFYAIPLVFPGGVDYVSVTTRVSRGRSYRFFFYSWQSHNTSAMLRVTTSRRELLAAGTAAHDTIHPDVLPEHWPLLVGYNFLAMDSPDLERLRQRRPRAFEALANWVHAGGVLLLRTNASDPRSQQQLLRRVSAQFQPANPRARQQPFRIPKLRFPQIHPLLSEGDEAPRQPTDPGTIATEQPGGSEPEPDETGTVVIRTQEEIVVTNQKRTLAPRQLGKLKRLKPFGVRIGAGLVTAIPQAHWNPATVDLVPEVPTVFLTDGPRFFFTEEQNVGMFGYEEWRLRIPSVGNPPVFIFLGLISLFVLVVGPLNYFWFRRQGALHRLLVTVPGASLLTTVVLLGYVLFSEGLDHKGRFVSLTRVDPSGRNVTWASGAYFSAIPPRQGLVFPLDTAVFFEPFNSSHMGNALFFRWDRQQHFEAGWIRARRLHRIFLARVHRGPRSLRFAPSAGERQPPRVTNRLGTTVLVLLAKDARGNLWWTRNLPAEQTQALRRHAPGDRATVSIALQVTRAMDQLADSTTFSRNGVPDTESLPPNALLWHLHRLTQWLARDGKAMPPGSWLAVVSDNPEMPTGTELTQIESFHVMVGHWP